MKNTEIMNRLTRSINKVGFKLKKHSPEILAVVGTVGTAASVVMACKATLKVNDVLDEAKENIDKVHTVIDQGETEKYTQEDANRDLAVIYIQTGWKFVKLYGPAIAVGAASLGCLLGSNHILRKRNAAALAGFTAVDKAFKEYRGRLRERFGENGEALDRELLYNIKAQEIERTEVDENGNETVIKETVEVIDPNDNTNIYSFFFDEYCTGWCKNAELNKVFVIQQVEAANYRLKTKGILTLNQFREMLGADTTPIGQFAGWVYTDDGSAGDNFIDVGLWDVHSEGSRDFINGREKSILLNPNCIGNVIDYM